VKIGSTLIDDTFAEAFTMRYCRLWITAHDDYWLQAAVREFTGYSASVIACDVEAGWESALSPDETPDGRPGAAVLVFAFSKEALATAVSNRVGQCVMTCATTAVLMACLPLTSESRWASTCGTSVTATRKANFLMDGVTGEFP
jgi:formylmethanofuran--tetrahydromethanopterin N-formyltransferase